MGMSYTRVTAPFAGLITAKSVEVGDLASPGMTLFQLEDNRNYRLEADVDESAASMVHVNDTVPVVIDTIGGDALQGTVAEIVPAADPASRTYHEIGLPAHDALRSGQFGRARFGVSANTLTIPRAAYRAARPVGRRLRIRRQRHRRIAAHQNRQISGDRIEVLSGLNEGDQLCMRPRPFPQWRTASASRRSRGGKWKTRPPGSAAWRAPSPMPSSIPSSLRS